MPTKRNTSDIRRTSSGNSYLSFSEWDDGNQPEQNAQAEPGKLNELTEHGSDSEEGREALRARSKNPQAERSSERRQIVGPNASPSSSGSSDELPSETTLGRKDNKGSPSSASKDWAIERMNAPAKTFKPGKGK